MSSLQIEREIEVAEEWYPTFDEPRKKAKYVGKEAGTAKLRPGLTPGTVVIVLAGRFKGRRVIFLKELTPGFLLLNGPYSVNKVPLLKMKQEYVIITSTKIEIPSVDLSKIGMEYFEKPKKAKKDQSQSEFFAPASDEKPKLTEEVVSTQKAIDDVMLPAINQEMVQYLRTPFTLNAGDRPHLMNF